MSILYNSLKDTKLGKRADKLIHRSEMCVEIGPGVRPQNFFSCRHYCIEPHYEYCAVLREAGYEVIQGTWTEIDQFEFVDTIFLLDVIEHLDKEDGLKLIQKCVEKANQIVVFTPLGFMEQSGGDEKDPWGYQGQHWQEHRSGWTPEDFPGWTILSDGRFHGSKKHGAFFAMLWQDLSL